MTRIAVIGGGITGLAAAASIVGHNRDIECTIYEASSRLGGKLQSEHHGGLVIDRGPSLIWARQPAVRKLVAELGLQDEVFTPRSQERPVIAWGGELHAIPTGTVLGIPADDRALDTSTLLSAAGKRRLRAELPAHRYQGDQTLGSLMRQQLGDEVVDRLAGPMLATTYAGAIDQMSIKANYPQLASLFDQHGSLLAGARQLRENRQAAGMRQPLVWKFRRGISSLAARLHNELVQQVHLELEQPVLAVERQHTHYTVQLASGVHEYDGIVLAVPAYQAARLLQPVSRRASQFLQCIPYTSVAVVAFGFARPLASGPKAILVPELEDRLVTAHTWEEQEQPQDMVLVRAHLGRAGCEADLDWSDKRFITRALSSLNRYWQAGQEPLFARVFRWPRALPLYTSGHLQRLSVVDEELSLLPAFELAGAGYHGAGVPSCISQGQQAAAAVLRDLAER